METAFKFDPENSQKFIKKQLDVLKKKIKESHNLGKKVEAFAPNFATEKMLKGF